MSQQKVVGKVGKVGKLERKIKLDTNKRNEKFLERQEANQIKNFNFVATLDYSDPRTQVFLMLLLSANVIGAQANRPPQPGTQSLTSTSKPLADSIIPNTRNATNIVTNALPSSDISIQSVRNSAPMTFFSHQFATTQMSAQKSSSPVSPEESQICVVPSRDLVTKLFSSIKRYLINGDFKPVLEKIPVIDNIYSLYTQMRLINEGSAHRIYAAIDKDDNEIVVRVSKAKVAGKIRYIPKSLAVYPEIVETRKFTPYLPEIYSAYYAKSTNFDGLYTNPDDFVFCMEMEFIPYSHDSLYDNGRLMGDRTIFQQVLGYYVVEKVAGCQLNLDGDLLIHHLYRKDENYVCYQLYNDFYLFPSDFSPYQVDYDTLRSLSEPERASPFKIEQGLRGGFLFYHASEEMKSFLNDINQKGLFESIKLHFSEFLISEEELKNYPNAKRFNLTELANRELQQSTLPEANANQLRI